MLAGLIGNPVLQSKSPTIHEFWIDKLGIEGASYSKWVTKVSDLAERLGVLSLTPYAVGVNVTMPLKDHVIIHCTSTCADVERTASANCLTKTSRGWHADNFDIDGIKEPLHKVRDWTGARATILGAGGAARSALVALEELGFDMVTMRVRTEARGEYALNRVRWTRHRDVISTFDPLPPTDLVINASPIGMGGFPEYHALDDSDWGRQSNTLVVFELVTKETSLQRVAASYGFTFIPGIEMLIEQAAPAFELFYGQKAPRELDHLLKELL